MNAVSLKADTADLFRNLRHAFSAKAMLSELLQNARRAGATQIDVVYDEAKLTLTVEDNGSGVGDLQKLLTAAASGWDAATVERENPFGLGFLAVLYAGDTVTVETVGQQFTANTENLIKGGSATVEACDRVAGTRITLTGHKWESPSGLSEYSAEYRKGDMDRRVAGFPVAVTFNGEPLASPLAMRGESHWIATEVGEVWIRDLKQLFCGGMVFVQGLPLHPQWNDPSSVAVHLNNTFGVKLPDRLYLLDPDAAMDRIKAAVYGVARQLLVAKKEELGPQEFVLRWSDACAMWQCQDLLDDIDWVPVSWFVDWEDSYPGYSRYGNTIGALQRLDDGSEVVSRETLSATDVYRMPYQTYGEEDYAFAAQNWMRCGKKWTMTENCSLQSITEGHWLNQLAIEVTDADFVVEVHDEVGEEDVSVWGETAGSLAVAGRIEITRKGTGETHAAEAAISYGTLYVGKEGVPHWATSLLDSYVMDDRYDEGAEHNDRCTLGLAFARIMASDPAELVATVLRNAGGLRRQARLANARIVIEFDENGSFRSAIDTKSEGLKFYAVSGRIPGDDEDTTHLFQAEDREHAIEQFKDALWSGKDEDHEDRAGTRDSEGTDTYINSVVVSDSPITDAQ